MSSTSHVNLDSLFKRMLTLNSSESTNQVPSEKADSLPVENMTQHNDESVSENLISNENDENCKDKIVQKYLLETGKSKQENVRKMIESVCSSVTLSDEKVEILACLSEKCKSDYNLYEILAYSKLIPFVEELLMTFCDTFIKSVPDSSSKELHLLKPLLKLLIPIANMSVQMINSTFLVQSDFLYHLMHAISLCSHNIVRTLTKLSKLTQGKCLTCHKVPMSVSEVQSSFENCFNIHLKILLNNLPGYHVVIFDNVDMLKRNINEEIIQTHTLTQSSQFYHAERNENNSFIEVLRVLPLKYVFIYTDAEWKEYLVDISSQVHKIIVHQKRTNSKPNVSLQKGDTVGFCSNEATFEGEALLMVPYLRGKVLSVSGSHTMLWAMDIGLLSYISVEKLHYLPYGTLITQAPLVSIGALQGPVCTYDSDFLEMAHCLLKDILRTNAQHGKHMFLSDIGEHILVFAEYPSTQVRIHILDIIFNLSNYCQEVRTFLEKQKFDITLAGKLERYAHSYGSDLCSNRAVHRIEMVIMSRILSSVFEDKTDIKNWPGNKQATRAFKILLDDPDIQWTFLFKNCLKQLDGKPLAQQQQDHYRGGSNNCRQVSHRPYFKKTGNQQWKENGKAEHHRSHFKGNLSSSGGDWKESNKHENHRPRFLKHNTHIKQIEQRRTGQEIHYQPYEEAVDGCLENRAKSVDDERSLSTQVDYLIRGSKVDVKCDQTHHLMTEKAVHDLQEMKLSQILCGLLNNNVESYLYFGITEDSTVEGMLLTRDNKDVFRNGIDRTMSKSLLPEVQVSSYDVIFTPVLNSGDKAISLTKKCLYVIEIRVRPLRHMVYALHQCRKCYIRRDSETLESTITQKKNHMIEMEEKALEEATNSIRGFANGYLPVLATFVNKYLPKQTDTM